MSFLWNLTLEHFSSNYSLYNINESFRVIIKYINIQHDIQKDIQHELNNEIIKWLIEYNLINFCELCKNDVFYCFFYVFTSLCRTFQFCVERFSFLCRTFFTVCTFIRCIKKLYGEITTPCKHSTWTTHDDELEFIEF